jgi:glycosyltransferase involved in cell wall biosynthesis
MGGIEFAGEALKACWERDGHQVTWLSTDLPKGARPTTSDNVRVGAINFLETAFQINSPLIPPWRRGAVLREVERSEVVNVHSLAPGLGNVVLHMALRLKKPTVVTQHVGIIPLGSRLLSLLQRHFVLTMARQCTARGVPLTFVGQAVRDWFVAEGKLDPAGIYMTPAGIDHTRFSIVDGPEREAFRARWELDEKSLNVLFVGRFYDKKGLPLIRRAAELCPGARFTLVGGGPVEAASWCLPNLRVISFVPDADLRGLYGAHDLFIMPSHGEGWPAVVPQAMACGLPCLISAECFAGYAKDADRFIVRRRDPAVLAETLQAAADGRIDLLRQRRALSDYARATWDWQRTARIYLDLFAQGRTNSGGDTETI